MFEFKFTLLKFETKSGIGKDSKMPYSFSTAKLSDDDANTYTFNIADSVEITEDMLKLRNVPIELSFVLRQKGYNLSAQITKIISLGK